MLYVLSLIGMSILLILLQLWLSSKKVYFRAGAHRGCMGRFLSLTVWTYSLDVPTKEEKLTCSLDKGRTAEATVTWSEDHEIIAVTDISIKDEEGTLIDEIAWESID